MLHNHDIASPATPCGMHIEPLLGMQYPLGGTNPITKHDPTQCSDKGHHKCCDTKLDGPTTCSKGYAVTNKRVEKKTCAGKDAVRWECHKIGHDPSKCREMEEDAYRTDGDCCAGSSLSGKPSKCADGYSRVEGAACGTGHSWCDKNGCVSYTCSPPGPNIIGCELVNGYLQLGIHNATLLANKYPCNNTGKCNVFQRPRVIMYKGNNSGSMEQDGVAGGVFTDTGLYTCQSNVSDFASYELKARAIYIGKGLSATLYNVACISSSSEARYAGKDDSIVLNEGYHSLAETKFDQELRSMRIACAPGFMPSGTTCVLGNVAATTTAKFPTDTTATAPLLSPTTTAPSATRARTVTALAASTATTTVTPLTTHTSGDTTIRVARETTTYPATDIANGQGKGQHTKAHLPAPTHITGGITFSTGGDAGDNGQSGSSSDTTDTTILLTVASVLAVMAVVLIGAAVYFCNYASAQHTAQEDFVGAPDFHQMEMDNLADHQPPPASDGIYAPMSSVNEENEQQTNNTVLPQNEYETGESFIRKVKGTTLPADGAGHDSTPSMGEHVYAYGAADDPRIVGTQSGYCQSMCDTLCHIILSLNLVLGTFCSVKCML